jgi:ABC-type sugar transport system permease subunit
VPVPRRARHWSTAYSFVLPVLGLTILFSVVPLVLVVQRSLYKGNIFGTNITFAGLANYTGVFRSGGGHSLVVTAVFTAGFVAVVLLLGLGLALLLDVKLPGLRHVRAFFVIPLVVPSVATAFIWFTFFQPDTGLFNRLLLGVGLPQVTLSSPTVALVAVIAFGAWQYFGEVVLIYLAALKALPPDVLEAASIDGAGAWQRLRYVRWPLLRQQTALYYVYQQAFGLGASGSVGLADAMSVILFLISLVTAAVLVVVAGQPAVVQYPGRVEHGPVRDLLLEYRHLQHRHDRRADRHRDAGRVRVRDV